MRTNSKIVVLGMLMLCVFYTIVLGQSETPSIDPEREVIVMFKSGAVTPPSGRTAGRPEEFQIPSPALRQILLNANVEAVSRLIPDFQPEDRFAVSRTGERVELTDWSNVYVLCLPSTPAREAILRALENRPEVVYAEINGRIEPDLVPNDQYFNRQWALKNDGTALQGSGTPGADIKATQAWDITTGSGSIKIGIVDNGMQTNHPDFTGRVTGDGGDNSGHGTVVTGIAAAQGNNTNGIAGVAWNVGIINEDYGNGSDAIVAAAVYSAANRGADVINNSWALIPIGRYSVTIRLAFAEVYKLDRVAVVSMGNQGQQGENIIQYPAAFGKGITTIGATTNTDVKANYSSTGSWIDVTAPGGGGFEQDQNVDYIYSTVPGGYDWFHGGVPNEGTSFSAPHVTGLSALLFSYNSNLYNDDIEQIIRLGVDDKGPSGWDQEYGTGRVNAYKALKLIMAPNQLVRLGSYTGGTVQSTSGWFNAFLYGVPGLPDGLYSVKRHEVIRDIQFPQSMNPPSVPGLSFTLPQAWGNGTATPAASTGLQYNNGSCTSCCSGGPLIYGLPHTEVVAGTITNTGCRLRTYVYEVKQTYQYVPGVCYESYYLGYFPKSPPNVQLAATVLGIPASQKVSTSEPTDESQTLNSLPETFVLHQNYPNPFNPTTEIKFDLPQSGQVTLTLFNIVGQKVRSLVDEPKAAGYHSVLWDGKDEFGNEVASGVYVYRIRVLPNGVDSQLIESAKKMTLMR